MGSIIDQNAAQIMIPDVPMDIKTTCTWNILPPTDLENNIDTDSTLLTSDEVLSKFRKRFRNALWDLLPNNCTLEEANELLWQLLELVEEVIQNHPSECE